VAGVGREAICREVAGGDEAVGGSGRWGRGGILRRGIHLHVRGAGRGRKGFHLHGVIVGGVNLHGGCGWGLDQEGSWGAGVKSGGFDRLGYRSQNSGGTVFAWGRLGLHHGMGLWSLWQPEVAPPGGLCREELQAVRKR